jgi:uncharacterized protein (TIGR02118 family)
MIKMMVSGKRKAGLSLEEFSHYWDTTHAAIADEVAEALRFKRYIQCVRIEAPGLEAFSEGRGDGGSAPDFVAELWFESPEDMAAAFASPEGQEASARLARDEENFIDRSSLVTVVTEEREKIAAR